MKRIAVIITILLVVGIQAAGAQQYHIAVTDTTTLRAPGYSAAVWCGSGYSKLLWYFKVASINTSVAIALQAKKGNSQWTNVFADSLVFTANDNYGIEWENVALADSVRFRFISEADGTDACITHNVALAGGI